MVADGLASVPACPNLEAVCVVDGRCHEAPHLAVQVVGRAVGRFRVLAWAAWPARCMCTPVSNPNGLRHMLLQLLVYMGAKTPVDDRRNNIGRDLSRYCSVWQVRLTRNYLSVHN